MQVDIKYLDFWLKNVEQSGIFNMPKFLCKLENKINTDTLVNFQSITGLF